MQGYALNEKSLQALERTVDIQTRMLADALSIEEADVLNIIPMRLLDCGNCDTSCLDHKNYFCPELIAVSRRFTAD